MQSPDYWHNFAQSRRSPSYTSQRAYPVGLAIVCNKIMLLPTSEWGKAAVEWKSRHSCDHYIRGWSRDWQYRRVEGQMWDVSVTILQGCIQGRCSHRCWGVMTPTFRGKGGRGDKVNVENTKITTENISIGVSQLQIKQRN